MNKFDIITKYEVEKHIRILKIILLLNEENHKTKQTTKPFISHTALTQTTTCARLLLVVPQTMTISSEHAILSENIIIKTTIKERLTIRNRDREKHNHPHLSQPREKGVGAEPAPNRWNWTRAQPPTS